MTNPWPLALCKSRPKVRFRSLCRILLASCLFCKSGTIVAAGISTSSIKSVVQPNVAEQYLFRAANNERTARGLKPLRIDPSLIRAAREHALQMAMRGDISHQFSGEMSLVQRGASAGARFSLISENVGKAPSSVMLHELWMGSSGHRDNLLDPAVDVVGIAVISQGAHFYAVEDFATSVTTLTYEEQERIVSEALRRKGIYVDHSPFTASLEDARLTCETQTGFGGGSAKPWYIVRYTADHLEQLPFVLQKRVGSGRYSKAVVGACGDTSAGDFADYHVAVLLYP